MQFDPNMNYPIRKETCFNFNVNDIINDLINGTETLNELAKKYNKSYNTIYRINKGQTHFNSKYSYPLRK